MEALLEEGENEDELISSISSTAEASLSSSNDGELDDKNIELQDVATDSGEDPIQLVSKNKMSRNEVIDVASGGIDYISDVVTDAWFYMGFWSEERSETPAWRSTALETFLFIFKHPITRFFTLLAVFLLNILMNIEDPMSYSPKPVTITFFGTVYNFLFSKYVVDGDDSLIGDNNNNVGTSLLFVRISLLLLFLFFGILLGKYFIHGCFLRDTLGLRIFKRDSGSWVISLLTTCCALYLGAMVYNFYVLHAVSTFHAKEAIVDPAFEQQQQTVNLNGTTAAVKTSVVDNASILAAAVVSNVTLKQHLIDDILSMTEKDFARIVYYISPVFDVMAIFLMFYGVISACASAYVARSQLTDECRVKLKTQGDKSKSVSILHSKKDGGETNDNDNDDEPSALFLTFIEKSKQDILYVEKRIGHVFGVWGPYQNKQDSCGECAKGCRGYQLIIFIVFVIILSSILLPLLLVDVGVISAPNEMMFFNNNNNNNNNNDSTTVTTGAEQYDVHHYIQYRPWLENDQNITELLEAFYYTSRCAGAFPNEHKSPLPIFDYHLGANVFGYFGLSEITRCFISAASICLELCVFMQDWDFPSFKKRKYNNFNRSLDNNNTNNDNRCETSSNLFFAGKWSSYSVLLIILAITTQVFINQLTYIPSNYQQHTENGTGQIYYEFVISTSELPHQCSSSVVERIYLNCYYFGTEYSFLPKYYAVALVVVFYLIFFVSLIVGSKRFQQQQQQQSECCDNPATDAINKQSRGGKKKICCLCYYAARGLTKCYEHCKKCLTPATYEIVE